MIDDVVKQLRRDGFDLAEVVDARDGVALGCDWEEGKGRRVPRDRERLKLGQRQSAERVEMVCDPSVVTPEVRRVSVSLGLTPNVKVNARVVRSDISDLDPKKLEAIRNTLQPSPQRLRESA